MLQPDKKKTVVTIQRKKKQGEKITSVTAYDMPSARVASDAGIDLLLVGDSLGMVLQGNKHTLKTTMAEMIYHTRMVAAAEPVSLLVADMPYGSFHLSPRQAVLNSLRFVKESGAEGVKLEGGRKRLETIKAILNAEIPVLGHLGLTPQSVNALGGFKMQGRVQETAERMLEEALELEQAGVFALVLESIPEELGKQISEALTIPTIGIGAGKYCDGQILVFHDMVGFSNTYMPKFVRKYADVYQVVHDALTRYIQDVRDGEFPGEAESFRLKKETKEK